MAQYSFPWNDVNGDRLYDAIDFKRFFTAFLKTGVVMSNNDGLRVRSAQNGMNIQVGAGAGVINGGSYVSDSSAGFQVNVASSLQDRKDSIVLKEDEGTRETYLYYKSNDTTVTRNETTYELQLAIINVPKNATQITDADITDMRGNSNVCGWCTPFDNVNVDGLVDQYRSIFEQGEAEFIAWFDSMKDQLSEDVAGKLQNQVNDLKTQVDENKVNMSDLLALVYPVGAYYMSAQETEPATLFGFGTWERIKGRTLVGVDESDSVLATANKEGGSTNPLTSHSHSASNGNFTYAVSGKSWASGATPSSSYALQTGTGTASSGSNANHANWQPFKTAYIWQRTE